ncbi:MAG: hemolysin family protein [Rickettsiales bacterium]|nr:hemolysin family protein [Rickettsiales bacterium]
MESNTVPEDGSTIKASQLMGGNTQEPHTQDSEKAQAGLLTWLLRKLGLAKEATLKDALQEVLDDHAEEITAMAEEERQILSNVMEMGDTDIDDIMIPQSDMVAVELSTNLNDLRDLVVESGHTRLPVYEDSLDSIKGFLHVKDLLPLLGNGTEGFHLNQILRDVVFVPEAMKVSDLLLKMRVSGVHLAIVVDEYGGTTGLATLEDLFEEIVGDIQDEHDEPEVHAELTWNAESTVIVDAKARIDELEGALKLDLQPDDEEDDYDTLGGLIFAQLGRVPTKGEKTSHASGIEMEVIDADERRIKVVRLTRPPIAA